MAEVLSERVAATVRAELARRQIKQAPVAELLGISVAQVSERMLGRIAFRLDEVELIAEYLGLPLTAFVGEVTVR